MQYNDISFLNTLLSAVHSALADTPFSAQIDRAELTLTCSSLHVFSILNALKSHEGTAFDQCMDLCGVDYSSYGSTDCDSQRYPKRFAVVYHLLSLVHNHRIRVVCYVEDNAWPTLPSVETIWSSANWMEREAFDFFGIMFENHSDLRRLLTDYGFVGHPFRKDYPVSGHVEMIYDETLGRVVYQPVTIEPREITPRIIREEQYGA